jgi:phosphatidylglycerophosphatase A
MTRDRLPEVPAARGDRWRWWIATCGGAGYAPGVPGTVGALWGVLIFLPTALCPEPLQTLLLALALLLVCFITFRLSSWSERYFGEKDCQKFVTDEVAGFLLTTRTGER